MKLYIIHGWTYSLEPWEKMLEMLQEAGHDPVTLRVPGLTIPSDYPWTIEDYVSWLREQIGEEENPLVIGHSNGGRIALNYAATHTHHLKDLILIDSAGIPRQERTLAIRQKIGRGLARILKPIIRGKLRQIAYRVIGAGDYGRAAPHMRETMNNMLRSDEQLVVEGILANVYMIWGEKDKSTPLYTAKELKRRIPSADRIRIIKGAGHSPQVTHPDEVLKHIEKILESIDANV